MRVEHGTARSGRTATGGADGWLRAVAEGRRAGARRRLGAVRRTGAGGAGTGGFTTSPPHPEPVVAAVAQLVAEMHRPVFEQLEATVDAVE